MLLGVWRKDVLVGLQGFHTKDYFITRMGETGSWLGQQYQGKGIGTAMRQIICAFALDHLDAITITSSAFLQSLASQTVSRRVGYREDGTYRERLGDEAAVVQRFVLGPGDLIRYEHPLEVSGLDAVRRSIGLDAPT